MRRMEEAMSLGMDPLHVSMRAVARKGGIGMQFRSYGWWHSGGVRPSTLEESVIDVNAA